MTQEHDTTTGAERRTHARIPRTEVLFVQVISAPRAGTDRVTLRCRTADLSPGGLCIELEDEIAVGTAVEAWIRLPEAERNFYLAGTVRWYRDGDGCIQLGVGLHAAPGTDFDAWRHLDFAVAR